MTREWYYQVMGEELGPLSVAELKDKAEHKHIQPDTLIRKGRVGEWLLAARVKGLFPEPKPAPAAAVAHSMPTAPPTAAPRPGAGSPARSDGSRAQPRAAESPPQPAAPKPDAHKPASMPLLADDEVEPHAPSMQFYDFVGFREAVSPALYDAVKKFIAQRGLTMIQANRTALANYIGRPELASDLMITAVEAIPQPVGRKSNRDGSQPLADEEQVEQATFRFTLFNSSQHPISVNEAVFLPDAVAARTYDQVAPGQFAPLDHTQHLHAWLKEPRKGEAIHVPIDCELRPEQAKDVSVWFKAIDKPSVTEVRGRLLLGPGGTLAISASFTIIIHGDSPPQHE